MGESIAVVRPNERYRPAVPERISVLMTSQPARKPYPSDLSDARWALMEPVLTTWRAERQKTSLNLGGKVTDLRGVMNAIVYVNRTGIAWRYLPHDVPPHTTVVSYFSDWSTDGTIEKLGVRLHRLVREKEGRDPEPTACVVEPFSSWLCRVRGQVSGVE